MYKVAIVDDEIKIVNLITRLIDWESFPLELMGTAHDGLDAQMLIEEEMPDIVILDIRMPGLNGIELIEKSAASGRDIHFLIISGYRHFEYAHKAIKYGVEDYLLKPIKEKELNQTLDKIINKISASRQESSYIEHSRQKEERDRLDHFLKELFTGSAGRPESLEQTDSRLSIELPQGNYLAALLSNDLNSADARINEVNLLKNKTLSVIETVFEGTPFSCYSYAEGQKVYLLLCYRDDRTALARQKLLNCLEHLRSLKELFSRLVTTIALTEPTDDLHKVKRRISEAEFKIQDRILHGAGTLLSAAPGCDRKKPVRGLLDSQDKMEMARAVEILNGAALEDVVHSVFTRASGNREIAGSDMLNLISEIINTFTLNLANHYTVPEETSGKLREFGGSILPFSSLEEIAALCLGTMKSALREQEALNMQKDDFPIKTAKTYIQENFFNPITLEEVSELAEMNPSYFSSLFKKKTGMGFLEYLTHVRIEEAKELLANPKRSISDTAGEVGYRDTKHFAKQFKKKVGLSPSEYRKLYF